MGKINMGRVIGAGLTAGLVMNVIGFVVRGLLLGDKWMVATTRLGLTPANQSMARVGFVITDFIFGIMLVWLYAAIRPRFGAGPKTAVIAAVFSWLIYSCTMGTQVGAGVYHKGIIAYASLGGLVAALAGALVGGMLYREDYSASTRAAAEL